MKLSQVISVVVLSAVCNSAGAITLNKLSQGMLNGEPVISGRIGIECSAEDQGRVNLHISRANEYVNAARLRLMHQIVTAGPSTGQVDVIADKSFKTTAAFVYKALDLSYRMVNGSLRVYIAYTVDSAETSRPLGDLQPEGKEEITFVTGRLWIHEPDAVIDITLPDSCSVIETNPEP